MAIGPEKTILALEQHEPVASPETIEAAQKVVSAALQLLSLSNTVLAGYIICMLRRVYTSAIDTFAVTLAGDGYPMLLVNPEFAVSLGPEQAVFVLAHEAYHLVMLHLHTDPALNGNQNWTIATEATINHHVGLLLGTDGNARPLPVINGEETGVNPRKVWEKYRDDLKKQEKTYVDEKSFTRTDLACFAELERMTRPPKMSGMKCVHADPNGGGQGGGQNGQGDNPVHLDPSEVGELVDQALNHAMHEAKANGSKQAKEELLKLADRTEGSEKASKIWGDLGLGSLRGETVATRKSSFWRQYLMNAIAERLEEGFRLKYQRKVWWDPRVAHRGDEPIKRVLLAVDASGSMRHDDIQFIADRLGEDDGTVFDMISFDGVVWPFELGQSIQGGGGTSFQIIDDYIQGQYLDENDETPDCVVVVTDGYAPHITPTEPDKWVWLIVPGGDSWPEAHEPSMTTFEIETDRASRAA